jgi:cupin 2 domain-containing protein
MEKRNLFSLPNKPSAHEYFEVLQETASLRLERIASKGHATPEGQWYDQSQAEWVVLLKGAARLRIAGETQDILLEPGDYVHLPAHLQHRVEWTDPSQDTIWLALHYAP